MGYLRKLGAAGILSAGVLLTVFTGHAIFDEAISLGAVYVLLDSARRKS